MAQAKYFVNILIYTYKKTGVFSHNSKIVFRRVWNFGDRNKKTTCNIKSGGLKYRNDFV